jgi:hypothetical protein
LGDAREQTVHGGRTTVPGLWDFKMPRSRTCPEIQPGGGGKTVPLLPKSYSSPSVLLPTSSRGPPRYEASQIPRCKSRFQHKSSLSFPALPTTPGPISSVRPSTSTGSTVTSSNSTLLKPDLSPIADDEGKIKRCGAVNGSYDSTITPPDKTQISRNLAIISKTQNRYGVAPRRRGICLSSSSALSLHCYGP